MNNTYYPYPAPPIPVQDEFTVKINEAQAQINLLKVDEKDCFAAIGKTAVEADGDEKYGDDAVKLRDIQAKIKEAEETIAKAQEDKAEYERKQAASVAARTCSRCGHFNPEGNKFCQQCGNPLASPDTVPTKIFCPNCGTPAAVDAKFCAGCGTKLS